MSICSNCYLQDDVIVHNINGRCDRCGGINFEDKKELDKELNENLRN